MSSSSQDTIKDSLGRLISLSGAKFTAEEVMREFRSTKDKNSNKKLLVTLKILTKHDQRARKHVADVEKLLERKDPYYCLVTFLKQYAESGGSPDQNKGLSMSHSPQNITESVTREKVSEIKERVVQAAISGINKSTESGMSVYGNPSLLFPAINKNVSNTSWGFQKVDVMHFQPTNVSALPIDTQESILLFDLIYCLSGMRGNYIYPEENFNIESDTINFKISEQIQISLRDMAYEIVPLAKHYIYLQKFIIRSSSNSCGQVLQSLSAALRSLIHDYYLLLSQLEVELSNGTLTLHKMLFYIQPTLNTMEVLSSVVHDIVSSDIRGGQCLTLLYDRINALTGDEESQKFLIQLTQLAAAPYMEMLQMWIQKGVIDDPLGEFLVEDNELIRREELPEHYSADYWEKRYTIRRERIPQFLEKVSDIILRTGKYLNVIRQCGKKVKSSEAKTLNFNPKTQNHALVIQSAYLYASRTLLEVLLRENDLMGHLGSVKKYFLLYQGDFITQFMDACEDELDKNVDHVLPVKLENLLGLTLRLSSAKYDPYKDDLHCELLTYDLATQMSKIINNEEEYGNENGGIDLYGLECFTFRYEVKWPVSLVLNHIAISKYQMLFRQLLYCKHVDRQLCKIWKANNEAKKFTPEAAELYRVAFALRQRMMNAIQNLEYYMLIEVIEPNWHIFIEKMNKVENVDDVLIVHQDFLDHCLKNCMVTDTTLLKSIVKLCNICLKFCEFIQIESSLAPTDTFSERVKKFDLEFTGHLIYFLKQIGDVASENPFDKFINLVHRINFNSYYNAQLDKLCGKDVLIT